MHLRFGFATTAGACRQTMPVPLEGGGKACNAQQHAGGKARQVGTVRPASTPGQGHFAANSLVPGRPGAIGGLAARLELPVMAPWLQAFAKLDFAIRYRKGHPVTGGRRGDRGERVGASGWVGARWSKPATQSPDCRG